MRNLSTCAPHLETVFRDQVVILELAEEDDWAFHARNFCFIAV